MKVSKNPSRGLLILVMAGFWWQDSGTKRFALYKR
jgi:hypothetical protein